MRTSSSRVPDELEPHRRHLFGLCYRMTGSAADAEDAVQETFVRAITSPPKDRDAPMRPWLTRVAVNLSRDRLRARKKEPYVGPWLPSPIPTTLLDTEPEVVGSFEPQADGAEHRYGALESVSFAFLLALEVLSPSQRAVLILREVCDYSVRETAEALGLSEPNVKTTHHRARAAMESYDQRSRAPRDVQQAALVALMNAFAQQDVPALEKLLAEDVHALNDGAGEYFASRVPLVGRAKVTKFHLKVTRLRSEILSVQLVELNGEPAIVLDLGQRNAADAPRAVMRCEVDAQGRITAIHSVLATAKLTACEAIFAPPAPPASSASPT